MYDYTEEFEVRACSKTELARAYSPGLATHSATNRLGRWMAGNAPLMEALAATGYTTRQRLLTARQVDIIVEHLGEP